MELILEKLKRILFEARDVKLDLDSTRGNYLEYELRRGILDKMINKKYRSIYELDDDINSFIRQKETSKSNVINMIIKNVEVDLEFVKMYKKFINWELFFKHQKIDMSKAESLLPYLKKGFIAYRLPKLVNLSYSFFKKYPEYFDWKYLLSYGFISQRQFEENLEYSKIEFPEFVYDLVKLYEQYTERKPTYNVKGGWFDKLNMSNRYRAAITDLSKLPYTAFFQILSQLTPLSYTQIANYFSIYKDNDLEYHHIGDYKTRERFFNANQITKILINIISDVVETTINKVKKDYKFYPKNYY